MNPIKTENSNHNFGAPVGHEDHVGDLPCEIDDGDPFGFGEGSKVIWAVYEPNQAERNAIAQGANVKLGIGWIGKFPPVSVGITDEKAVAE
jgi:hypothetical protein